MLPLKYLVIDAFWLRLFMYEAVSQRHIFFSIHFPSLHGPKGVAFSGSIASLRAIVQESRIAQGNLFVYIRVARRRV